MERACGCIDGAKKLELIKSMPEGEAAEEPNKRGSKVEKGSAMGKRESTELGLKLRLGLGLGSSYSSRNPWLQIGQKGSADEEIEIVTVRLHW